MNARTRYVCFLIVSLLCLYSGTSYGAVEKGDNIFIQTHPAAQNNAAPQSVLQSIYTKRCGTLVTGQTSALKYCYDLSQKKGVYSLDHEALRAQYLKNWSKRRGIRFTNISSTIRVKKTVPKGSKIAIFLEETYKFDYIYPGSKKVTVNSFGVGLRHNVTMEKKSNRWVISSDYYTDCFEDALSGYAVHVSKPLTYLKEIPVDMLSEDSLNEKSTASKSGRYNRYNAVQYADKYCGAAWGSRNNYKYNPLYNDYNGIGGDCTNFISQVLGDKAAGGLPFDSIWYYRKIKSHKLSISKTWINASSFKNYILRSGRGKLIKKGTFVELTKPSDEFPYGAVAKLKVGDLICYEKRGHTDHFAVVTGKDSFGYPLVNSHTTDRYHVPWDLGWGDRWIKFNLIHIND